MGKARGLLPLYHPQEGVPIIADVVFVHGLFGDRQQTWTKKLGRQDQSPDPSSAGSSKPRKQHPSSWRKIFSKPKPGVSQDDSVPKEAVDDEPSTKTLTEIFWPRDLLPQRFPGFRTFTWGYDVDIDHTFSGTSTATVFQHAANLLSDVADVRPSGEAESIPLIFVAHSLGGIVVKDALNQSLSTPTHLKAIAPATMGVCFLGTPHRGASIAALGETIYRISTLWGKSPNLRVLQALKYDAETLDRVQSGFKLTLIDARCNIKIRSFREAEKTHGVTIVDRASSVIGDPMEIVSDIHADHPNMTKFIGMEDAGFLSLCSALDRWFQECRNARGGYNAAILRNDFFYSLENNERRQRVEQVANAHHGTFKWLFDPEVGFQSWLSATRQAEPIFWVSGKPGSGKSTLMKYALGQPKTRELLAVAEPGTWNLVPFFFHDRGSVIQKSILGLLQELLYGLIEANEKLVEFVLPIMIRRISKRNAVKGATMLQRNTTEQEMKYARKELFSAEEWSIDDLQEALTALTVQTEVPLNILFFIDALDEHEGNHRDLIKVIRTTFLPTIASTVNVKFCLASRPEPAFRNAFETCPGFLVHEHTRADVQWYAHEQIISSILCQDIDQDMTQLHELTAEITQKANGVFIWVRIVVEELIERYVDGSSISQLREVLSAMPEELKDLYHRALSKIKTEYALESYIMIQIVLCAKNPQTLTSLLAATDLALHEKVETMSHARMSRRLGSRCGGLLEETGGQTQQSQVQFLHQTLKTFFTNRKNATSMFRQAHDIPGKDGSYYMLKYCIYIAVELSSDEFQANSDTLKYLFTYARDTSVVSGSELGALLDGLLQKSRCSAFHPMEFPSAPYETRDGLHNFCSHSPDFDVPMADAKKHRNFRSYDLLTVALSYGVFSYVAYTTSYGLPPTPPKRWPLLHSALCSALLDLWAPGHNGSSMPVQSPLLIKWLLEKGADPGQCNGRGAPALNFVVAVICENNFPGTTSDDAWPNILECIKTLLVGGANPNIIPTVQLGRGPPLLSLAVTVASDSNENYLEMVRTLLEHGADYNQTNSSGFRPLFSALIEGHWQAAELLLQYGANPSDVGNGMNPLRLETCRNVKSFYQSVIKMQSVLQEYATKSERQSRRNSITTGEDD